ATRRVRVLAHRVGDLPQLAAVEIPEDLDPAEQLDQSVCHGGESYPGRPLRPAWHEPSRVVFVSDAERQRLYLVTSVPGPMWDRSRERREQEGWDAHATFMNSLEASGDVVLGGPAGDGDEALVLIDAPSEEAARALLADDPWSNTILRIASVVEWTILLDSRPTG